ncbi:MAG: DUF6067 family protein, partial [Lentisphaeria bacterium]|nr:DUF6067 family protein [Lentisphaeria bacterium]
HGVRYRTPAYKDGMNVWPCVDGVPDVKDWSGYDRMVLDVVNAGASRSSFSVYASDSKTKIAFCLLGNFWLSGEYEILRIVLPFSKMEAKIDWTDMSLVHISSNTSSKDTDLYIGGIYLLKPGEEPPMYSNKFLADVRDHVVPLAEKMFLELESLGNAFAEETEELRPELQRLLEDARGRFDKITGLFSSDPSVIPQLYGRLKEMNAIRNECIRQFYQKRFDYAAKGSEMVVGVASSMERVMPKDHPFDYSIRRDETVTLARNEWQSFQLAVCGYNRGLKNVSVVPSDLHSADGLIFPAVRIECQTVGYVQTKNNPPYNPDYIGWWPDPILNFQHSCDIEAGDIQSFWIRIYSDKRQRPGIYTGKLTVQADGVEPVELNLTIHVRDFLLPEQTPLPTAIHTEPPEIAGAKTEKWQAMKYVYADFLGDYHVDFDQLYRWGEPDWDVILYLREQGRLSSFNLGSSFISGVKDHVGKPGSFEREVEKFVNHMRPTYE